MQQTFHEEKSKAFFESSFSKISDAYDSELLRKTLLVVAFIGTLGHIGFLFLFMGLGIPELSLFNLFSILMWLSCFYTLKNEWIVATISIIAFEIVLHATIVTAVIGTQAGFHFYLWPLMTLLLLIPSAFKYIFIGLCFVIIALFMWLTAVFSDLEYIYEFEGFLKFVNLANIFLAASSFIVIMRFLLNTRANNDKKLYQMANMDDFTQTYNRRFIYALMGDANKSDTRISKYVLVLADLDNFKRVNDTYGHGVGEDIILEVTKVIKSSVNSTDIVSRWSGQEFLLILNEASRERTLEVLENIQLELCRKIKKPSPQMDDVTFSFGVAINHSGKRFADALQKADSNLHKAKDLGKDRVVIDSTPL